MVDFYKRKGKSLTLRRLIEKDNLDALMGVALAVV